MKKNWSFVQKFVESDKKLKMSELFFFTVIVGVVFSFWWIIFKLIGELL